MEFLLLLFGGYALYKMCEPRPSGTYGGPIAYRSDNGYEGHLDFLEMHGFISEEERREDRDLAKDIKDHPEKYETVNLREFL